MLKYSVFAAVALAAATPAYAQDSASLTGGYVQALAGYDHGKVSGIDSDDGIAFGAGAGYDFALSSTVFAGIEGEAMLTTGEIAGFDVKRDLYAGIRIGAEVAPGTSLYLKGGYSNLRIAGDNGDGIRVGGGLEHRFSGNLFVKGEYRYTNYEADASRHQLLAGLGIRF
jgi:outer membrane immunogenic protein